MDNQVTPRLVCMKDPVTGERVTVPVEEAPRLQVSKVVEQEKSASPIVSAPIVAPSGNLQAYNVAGDFVTMGRSYYRGQSGINTYSNTVSYAGAVWFIEELSGADFNAFKAQLKELSFEIKTQQEVFAAQQTESDGLDTEDPDDGDEWVRITQRKTEIHREVIEKSVRGCTDPNLATRAGRDKLYQKSVEELAALIISASLLGKDGSDFLAE